MTLTLELPVDTVERLRRAAAAAGVPVDRYAQRVLESGVPAAMPSARPDPTLALLEDWSREDATNDAGELAARRLDLDDLLANLDRNRLASDGPDARKLFP